MYSEPVQLPVGILSGDGRQLRDLILNNQTQRITRAAQSHPDFSKAADDYERGLVVFAHRLRLPDLDGALALDAMLDLDESDIEAIIEADRRLQERIRRFPDTAKSADPGTADDGAPLGGRE